MSADHRRVPDLRVSVMDSEVEAISPNSQEKVSHHLAKSHGLETCILREERRGCHYHSQRGGTRGWSHEGRWSHEGQQLATLGLTGPLAGGLRPRGRQTDRYVMQRQLGYRVYLVDYGGEREK